MKETLTLGCTKTLRVIIDDARTIDFMGEEMRVYATPELVRDIEMTCREILVEHSDAGEDSVGTRVVVDHMGATLKSMWVDITATVTAVEGPLVHFEVTANDALEQIARGSHRRFSVPVSKLEQKLKAKLACL
ncbi:thioesterase family protein [Aestuariirhabdus litorea]|uniref:LysR family transcriptional regulator n=1 Tax=Aestuariirhabdus litorea TaxID=2528527 RepID=A0A3P3VIB8_9GAMM|nr:LysR family transcriptional regulator [Aestuariirhabdus litorea]RRJ82412.1 LysR family transcriptional regulator [Aestuariirhabdus litorea]RWW92575.1 LysR family transcriptional regulator [Endozoicomonadaceae bacterium GTF-13]